MNLSTCHVVSLMFQVDGTIATLTPKRPKRKNSITFDSYAKMAAIFHEGADDDTTRALVVSGAGAISAPAGT